MKTFPLLSLVTWSDGNQRTLVGLVKKSTESILVIETFDWGWDRFGIPYLGLKLVEFYPHDSIVESMSSLV